MKDVAKTVSRIKILVDRYNKMCAGNKNTKSPGAKKKTLRQIKHLCHLVGARWYWQDDKLYVDFSTMCTSVPVKTEDAIITVDSVTVEPADAEVAEESVVDTTPEPEAESPGYAKEMEADGCNEIGMIEVNAVPEVSDEPVEVEAEEVEDGEAESVDEVVDDEPTAEEIVEDIVEPAAEVQETESEEVESVENNSEEGSEEPVGNFTSRF